MANVYRNSIEEAKAAAEKLTAERLKDVIATKERENEAVEAEVVDTSAKKK